MSSSPNALPISLRPAPKSTNSAIPLPLLISRINAERGSFRNLSEDSLRQEIAEAEAGGNKEVEEESSSDDEDEEEEKEEPDRMKELLTARDEILGQIEHAHNSAMIALDFVSLLLSKDAPIQAGASMSPALREAAGMGTLGAEKTQASRVTEQQKQENKKIARGWKASNLNKTVDSILASATRLEKEIDAETKYWEQVLAVSESGWAVCRMPQEKHTLGVRFGFAEAAPAFRNRSLAALRRNPDGSIYLDQGIISKEPQYLRVRIETNGITTGETILPKAVPEGAPIQDLIFQARNTIFAAELWQELHREVRSLASYRVESHSTNDTITCPLSPTKYIILDLQPLPNDPFRPVLGKRPDSYLATAVHLMLHLLLSLAHRQNHRKRTAPPPPISHTQRPNQAYHLLRSVITRLSHESSISSLHSLLSPLCTTLASPSHPHPLSYIITPSSTPQFSHLPTPERILTSLVDRLESITTLNLPIPKLELENQTSTLTIQTLTSLLPFSKPTFRLSLTPASSPLATICPPPLLLGEWIQVKEYVFWAVGCWLGICFGDVEGGDGGEGGGDEGWRRTTQGNVLRRVLGDAEGGGVKQVVFEVGEAEAEAEAGKGGKGKERETGVKIAVRWEWTRGVDGEVGSGRRGFGKGEGVKEWVVGGGNAGLDGNGNGNVAGKGFEMIREVLEEAGRAG
ncbi:RNA polymerase II mediator complex subunit [Clarireedia jacksonii]